MCPSSPLYPDVLTLAMAEIDCLKATIETQSQHVCSLEAELNQQQQHNQSQSQHICSSLEAELVQQHQHHQSQIDTQRRQYQTQLVTQHLQFLQHQSELQEIQAQQHRDSQAHIEAMPAQTLSLYDQLAQLRSTPSPSATDFSTSDSGSGEAYATGIPVCPSPSTPAHRLLLCPPAQATASMQPLAHHSH
ncbi:hypothetical protein SEMRO_2931_G340490.1 [Seminavis robusta]|uniref:Uncharacterized protein n=1 Tax=Seminavis robusta TaxID=568900 RepID=A0A9N8HZJ0_9STRA|nr:hypothetical protein SEMRO_2931_G340490.1 [Seminavis robusta]|eukprot:Sro2931_g340490.1 n/a (190) ;mRNA; r:3561-4130